MSHPEPTWFPPPATPHRPALASVSSRSPESGFLPLHFAADPLEARRPAFDAPPPVSNRIHVGRWRASG